MAGENDFCRPFPRIPLTKVPFMMAQQSCKDASVFYPKVDMDGDLASLCSAMRWMPGCRFVKAHFKATTKFLRVCAAEEQDFSGAVVGDFRRQYLAFGRMLGNASRCLSKAPAWPYRISGQQAGVQAG